MTSKSHEHVFRPVLAAPHGPPMPRPAPAGKPGLSVAPSWAGWAHDAARAPAWARHRRIGGGSWDGCSWVWTAGTVGPKYGDFMKGKTIMLMNQNYGLYIYIYNVCVCQYMTIYVYVGNDLEVWVIFMTIQDQIQLLYKCDYKTVSYPRPSQQKLAMNQPQWAEIASENQCDVTRKKSDAMGSQTRNSLIMTAYPVAGDICEADMTDIYLCIFIYLSIVLSLSFFIYLIYLYRSIYLSYLLVPSV